MTISRELFCQIMMLDNFTCVYCGVRGADVQIDHLIPRSVGGPDVLHNLVAACASCNATKGDRPLHEVFMPRFGRFARATFRDRSDATKPPPVEKQERFHRIRKLTVQRKADGQAYRFSANDIAKLIGGTRGEVLEQVRAVRGLPAFPQLDGEGRQVAEGK